MYTLITKKDTLALRFALYKCPYGIVLAIYDKKRSRSIDSILFAKRDKSVNDYGIAIIKAFRYNNNLERFVSLAIYEDDDTSKTPYIHKFHINIDKYGKCEVIKESEWVNEDYSDHYVYDKETKELKYVDIINTF